MRRQTIPPYANRSKSSGRPRLAHVAHGPAVPSPSTNASSAPTDLASKHAPKRAPKLAPWFAPFCATSGATFSAHPIDKMLSHSSEFLPRPCAVTNPVTQPTPCADPALPTTVKITGRPGSAPGWEDPQPPARGRGRNSTLGLKSMIEAFEARAVEENVSKSRTTTLGGRSQCDHPLETHSAGTT